MAFDMPDQPKASIFNDESWVSLWSGHAKNRVSNSNIKSSNRFEVRICSPHKQVLFWRQRPFPICHRPGWWSKLETEVQQKNNASLYSNSKVLHNRMQPLFLFAFAKLRTHCEINVLYEQDRLITISSIVWTPGENYYIYFDSGVLASALTIISI